ncbi:phage major capsid protein [Kocuria palustris]|uniref:phage major capsid protein n=1 Tax=Kocuria palustris TaxID=71999 RepID=UPI003BF84139
MAQTTINTTELTQEQVSSFLVAPLEEQSQFLAAGPKIFDTSNALRIPKLPTTQAEQLQFVGELEQIPEVDADFDEMHLLPSTMKSVKVLTRFSNELARQSIVALDSVLQQRLVADVAAKIDAQLLSDTGDGITTPRGLFAYQGTQDLPVDGALTLDAILEAQGLALGANVNPDGLTLFIRPEDYMGIRSVKDADGHYLVKPDATAGGLVVPLLGAKVAVSSRIPAGRAALVDMSQIAVARDVAPSVKILDQTFGDTDAQAIRVVTRMDADAMNPEAVITFSGVSA